MLRPVLSIIDYLARCVFEDRIYEENEFAHVVVSGVIAGICEADRQRVFWHRRHDDSNVYRAGALAADALTESEKGFGNYVMVIGIIETVALFVMVFLMTALR